MRKLVLILMGLIAVATFIRAYSDPSPGTGTDILKASIGGTERQQTADSI